MLAPRYVKKLRLFAAVLAMTAASANAQISSTGTVTIVVPFAPGGSADVVARGLANQLSQSLSRTVIVENRAGGVAGLRSVATAKNDGTMLMVTPSGPISITGNLQKLPYDPVTGFTPIAMITRVPAGIAVHAESKYRTFDDLVNAGKASKQGLNYSVPAIGTHMHLMGELLAGRTGAHLVPIPYRGTSLAANAVIAGDVDFVVSDLTSLLPQVKGGRLRMLALTDSKRASVAPDIPTVSESGVQGASADAWIGLFGPPNLPAEFVKQLNAEVKRALDTPQMRSILEKATLEPMLMTPDEMKSYIAKDFAQWGQIIKERNIKVE
jgi:tripartite-type tricarboxylate transporter receptor subunit TctC